MWVLGDYTTTLTYTVKITIDQHKALYCSMFLHALPSTMYLTKANINNKLLILYGSKVNQVTSNIVMIVFYNSN